MSLTKEGELRMQYNREDTLQEARQWVERLDRQVFDDDIGAPSWLKVEEGTMRYYFDEKHTIWEKGVGWYPKTERVYVE